ncbi:hypothetical protein C8E05_1568 [Rhodococcus wratislaviensis]|uniref:Uncharacterized protein n=1 Tax=Rhodococcus wratislaviensis TaxID=44752 RepID=A0AB38FH18_RHOWR|nr:hypothetical protein [Rhodococcus wratislaviensis]REE72180.1 hypothetical protein C8E05_1568 [Rhodococcus wratislaviensis]SPZ40804.1 Uncharacterised protein [Rhodococcus wratislaviensis]
MTFTATKRLPTEGEQYERFQDYLAKRQRYVDAGGSDVSWTDDDDERFELYRRKWNQPAPPSSLPPIKSVKDYATEGWH